MCFMFLIKKQGLEVIKIRAIRVGHNASRFYLAILPSNLSISKRSILFAVLDILVCRTDDTTALEVELFYAVGSPTNDTCHGKYRSIDFLWQTNHLVYETRIEVEVGSSRLCTSASHQALDALLLYKLQEFVFLHSTLLLG